MIMLSAQVNMLLCGRQQLPQSVWELLFVYANYMISDYCCLSCSLLDKVSEK